MERLNNWMSYSFDDQPEYIPKPNKSATFKLHFKKGLEVKDLSYLDALIYNGQMLKDNYSEPFDVLLSGGIDSEVVVRTFHKIGARQNVYTFRLEDDLNKRDVESAIQICNDMGIKLNIIDFNLKKWFENEAHNIYNITHLPTVEKLVRFSYYSYLDNIPVLGEGEPYWRRELNGNYSTKSDWKLHLVEYDFMHSMYGKQFGRTIIGEWYLYAPEVLLSFHKIPLIQKLLNDEIPGKISSWSSRTEIHRELWPGISTKPKLVGYEGDGHPFKKPDYMLEFENTVMANTSNICYKYSTDEVDNFLK